MNLSSFRLKNFRRFKDAHVELDPQISILVGANNSGKTSATHGLKKFVTGNRSDFSFHDFSASCWGQFDLIGGHTGELAARPVCPTMSVDLWFKVKDTDLHRVIALLPSLEWETDFVGLRIEFAPVDLDRTLSEFSHAKAEVAANADTLPAGTPALHLWPRSFSDYLTDRIPKEFELNYYVLDRRRFDECYVEIEEYFPPKIATEKGKGASLIDRLLRVDLMDAQRHLSENSGGRSEDLSRCLGRFYRRNLEKLGTNYSAMGALVGSQEQLNTHLKTVFDDTLKRLEGLGYPGLGNPKIEIKSSLNPATILASNDGARVYYAIDGIEGAETTLNLPDQYNGLGFKNLIYMVVELLDLHEQWRQIPEDRAPLHVIIIEEPEAHMHAQLQQAFIREILRLLPVDEDHEFYTTQFLITTHSSHILYERGFKPIRYFRRNGQETEVINLSSFYQRSGPEERDFLERYLKITHCDLFFADAAILVEGNVERLLMPLFISKVAPRLSGSFLTILEVGGAFGHRFKSLIEYLGITCLVITDIDSVEGGTVGAEGAEDAEDAEEEDTSTGKACIVDTAGAVTSNQTLIKWLPGKRLIAELLQADDAARTQLPSARSHATIKVCFQTRMAATWGGATAQLVGRTLEEAFALENLEWCQHKDRKALGLGVHKATTLDLATISTKLYRKVKGSGFNKTNFALALMFGSQEVWKVPHYIAEGLLWLEGAILPPDVPTTNVDVNGEGDGPTAPVLVVVVEEGRQQ